MNKTVNVRVLFLAALITLLMAFTALANTGIGVEPGQAMPDFTVSLTDGTTASLSEVLKEKDLVVLNIFASWCGPCEREFPEMEEVYREKKDRMEIISVSGDPDDTMEVIADYKASHGLSFPMGVAGDGLNFLSISAYPTTVFIDRSSMTGFVKVGAFASREDFEEKVDHFLSADYDGTPLEAEEAFNILPYLLGVFVLNTVLLIIGRWGILRKAGKKGWHSLIPFFGTFTEYSVCWTGLFGVLADLCRTLSFAASMAGLPAFIDPALRAAGFLIGLLEGLKLAKAFGKGRVFGILTALPVIGQICRLILGLGRAEYRAAHVSPASGTAAGERTEWESSEDD